MKVLLTQDVFNLGHAGDVKTVAAGYGRNFLLPRGMAVLATEGAVKNAEKIKNKGVTERAKNKAAVDAQAALINGAAVTVHARAGEKGKLFGSVTAAHIAAELARKLGFEVDKRKIGLREPIRDVGVYSLPVRLATDVSPTITVTVMPEGVIEAAPVAAAPVVAVDEAPADDAPAAE
jgi:large subunit ribosomal protein L9